MLMLIVVAIAARAAEASPRWRRLLAAGLALFVGCGVVLTVIAGSPS
jgi:hypothetical protein